ncbi:MAG: sulfatase-like hydrolase/transferase [Verrucomicrobia bacterium]|nr:sulfatase-like hydrolase/transferase [Verrucomicrobiota bacterium]
MSKPLFRSVLLILGALMIWTSVPASSNAAERLNILFLFADDQRADTIAAQGNPNIQTPNLDRLVGEGFSFRANYCFGSNSGAVCIPSRAMLMSGRTWLKVDHNLTGVKILPELLRENGYTTFVTGKWHNQAPALLRGFERGKSVFLGGMADHTQVQVQDIAEGGRLVNKRTASKFSSEEFADAMVDFLDGYQEEAPFFAYAAFTAPHDPRNPPEAYREQYYRNLPPLPKNFLPQHPFDNGNLVIRDEALAGWPRTKEVVQSQLAEYYGLITHLDEQIGRILKALEKSGRADKTLIIYSADHGLAIGSHGLLGKQSLYEHSMKCPLIFVGPGIPKGGSSDAFTYLFDILPTLCSVTGIAEPGELAGHSLEPIWLGKQSMVRNSVFLPYGNVMRSVRDEQWKLISYPQINHRQLFDLKNDPLELHDLAGDPDRTGDVTRLLTLTRAWQQKVGDTQPLTTDHPKPMHLDLTGRKRQPDNAQPDWIRAKYFGLND